MHHFTASNRPDVREPHGVHAQGVSIQRDKLDLESLVDGIMARQGVNGRKLRPTGPSCFAAVMPISGDWLTCVLVIRIIVAHKLMPAGAGCGARGGHTTRGAES